MNPERNCIITTRPIGKRHEKIECPDVVIVNYPVTNLVAIPFPLEDFLRFDPEVVIITSSFTVELLSESNLVLKDRTLVAIGDSTASALREHGYSCIVPEEKTSLGITKLISSNPWREKRFALLSSAQSNMIVRDFLQRNSYRYIMLPIYDSQPADLVHLPEVLGRPDCLGIVFTSSQEVRVAMGHEPSRRKIEERGLKIFAIGEITARAISEFALSISEPVGHSDLSDLICKIRDRYIRQK